VDPQDLLGRILAWSACAAPIIQPGAMVQAADSIGATMRGH
jgi:hypothetical protein